MAQQASEAADEVRKESLRIGMVSPRFQGTDGVSLEARKWVDVLQGMGHECCFFSGQSNWEADRSMTHEKAFFGHPEIAALQQQLFHQASRTRDAMAKVVEASAELKAALYDFFECFRPDLIIAENVLSLPMNVPLGIALAEFIAETRVPAIGHHHDFWFERARFSGTPSEDILDGFFPPRMPNLHHVVINSMARRNLSFREGLSAEMIPNVMDFESPPPQPDAYIDDLRANLGIGEGQKFVLQPTRIVPRKQIERAIELVRRIRHDAVLVITHEAGDEGQSYLHYLRDVAEDLKVKMLAASEWFGPDRGEQNGHKVYSLADAYQACDIVSYPSSIEGFGNAFLEAIYYRKPLVLNCYEIYDVDIRPKGFKTISMHGYPDRGAVEQVEFVLDDPQAAFEDCKLNYELGRRYYSYNNLRTKLRSLLNELPI